MRSLGLMLLRWANLTGMEPNEPKFASQTLLMGEPFKWTQWAWNHLQWNSETHRSSLQQCKIYLHCKTALVLFAYDPILMNWPSIISGDHRELGEFVLFWVMYWCNPSLIQQQNTKQHFLCWCCISRLSINACWGALITAIDRTETEAWDQDSAWFWVYAT